LNLLKIVKVKNEEYVKWYGEMVDNLEKMKLPYAFADYFSQTSGKHQRAMK
jgi:hypothetical protein